MGDFTAPLPPCGPVPALYATQIVHTRRAPVMHHFRHQAMYWLVDFDRLPSPRGILGHLARFERADHADVRAFLAERGVVADRILMLTMARTFGYVFNPISVFWCYDTTGTRVAVLAEVHNTYGGRHIYLLRPDTRGHSKVKKEMYVSPFYVVDGSYDIRVSEPGATFSVTVTLRREDDAPFVATMRGERREVTKSNVVRASFIYPAVRATVLIYWEAARLSLRGLKVQPR